MNRHVKNVIICVGFGVLVSLALWQWTTIRKLNRRIETFELDEHEYRMARLIHGLRIPSEVLYYDSKVQHEIAQIRLKCYKEHGVTTFWPYQDMFGDYVDAPDVAVMLSPASVPADDLERVFGSSFENWWFGRSFRVIESLEFDIERGQGLGLHFIEHPEEFETLVKPLLIRTTKATEPMIRMPACRLLLTMGDRSEEVITAIQRTIDRPKVLHSTHQPGGGKREHMDYDMYTRQAIGLNNNYGLGLKRTLEDE